MKIDRGRLRKGTSEVPLECQVLIERLRQCSRTELLDELSKISTWTFGKCELYHWIGVLDIFDSILEEAADAAPDNKWALHCDTHYNSSEKKLLLWTLHFTTLLIEHSFSRHLYNSMEHLLALLSSSDMSVVLGVLNLLYMFSKRSNFIARLANEKRQALLSRLLHLAESWGGKENGFGLADCCNADTQIPPSATTLHFEFHRDHTSDKDLKETKDSKTNKNMNYIHIENVDKIHKTPAEIMKGLVCIYFVPPDKEMSLFTHVRLAHHFADYKNRLLCVQARLQALSVLVYSNALQDSAHTLLYNGLLEELVELVELKQPYLVEIRSAALRTLTSIIHLDRNPHFPKKPGSRLNNVIDVTGASQYHGFLPVLVRNCISSLTRQTGSRRNGVKRSRPASPEPSGSSETDNMEETDAENVESAKYVEYLLNVGVSASHSNDLKAKFPLPLATALFSFLYHLASYESGGDALVSCGMMESLLQVINWHGVELEHITFVTRAVRVIDLITNIDMQAFHTHGGLQSFINRLDVEVNLCRKEQSYEFKLSNQNLDQAGPSDAAAVEEDAVLNVELQYNAANSGKTCLPQRAALLKSMLNFLKKALQDSTFTDNIRHLMEGTLPSSLKHIISNAEYYGPSLFLLATDVVTVYVFQEPSLLSALQDNGLTDVILYALLIKDVPATREVLGSLPNVFSALCINNRGLAEFVKCRPFERLFKVLLSPNYLSAMRRRRSSDPLGDTASNLGNAMDELMRHQPSLKVDATAAIIKLLHELCQLGSDPKYICWRPHSKSETSPASIPRSTTNAEGSSDEEDEDEEEASTSSHNAQNDSQEQEGISEKTPIALIDYILNTMKFIDAILSNNSTDDHCREFVNQGGLEPLLKILGLPNLPVDCPITASAQAVASVCKSILNLAHESKVLKQGLIQLDEVLHTLKPLCYQLNAPGGSQLLHELANAPHLETAFSNASATPLLHAMGAAHGYVLMFVHVCRTGQSEIRTLSLQHWGSNEGLLVLKGLAELYTSLVWESTLLLALCSDDPDCDFGQEDMEKLNLPFTDKSDSSSANSSANGDGTANVATAMECLSTNPPPASMDIDGEPITSNKPTIQQLKYIKPLLGASSRLGRALAELFGLLVKLCVGSPVRQRRGQNIVSTPPLPSPHAISVAKALNYLLSSGLNSERLPQNTIPKFRLTFLICSVGFTSPMLFDEKRYPYHLMLQKFVSLGGLSTFFNTFKWALSAGGTISIEEGLEHPDLPEGTGEFLDAWLLLLEKMVNPKAILDSPHVISGKSSTGTYKPQVFDPLKYLIRIHKLAFEAIMLLWGRQPLPAYGVRMSESILSILRHILRGEKIIKERLSKTEETTPEAPPTGTRGETDVNQENLRQLMDMGFTRDHALDALMHTINVEQATDYLLSNPPHLVRAGTSGMEVDMSEDDQVMQAIALSLGEASPSAQRKRDELNEDFTPLTETVIDKFADSSLIVCLNLVDTIPEAVYKVCDLLITVMKRNGPVFRDRVLDTLIGEIKERVINLLEDCTETGNNIDMLSTLTESDKVLRLGYYIHLYTLFFEVPSYFDMRIPCAFAVYRARLVPHFINLISVTERVLSSAKTMVEPKWLTPLLLLLDSLGRVATCSQRKHDMHLVTNRVWKWYDLVTGKWTPYSSTNNKLINDAYWNGEPNIKVTCGRRRYTITFSSMLQCNDESGNNRPISMTPINILNENDIDGVPLDPILLTDKEEKRCIPAPNFTKQQTIEIVKSCVKLMHLTIDKDLLHAVMRICVRFTRDYDNARIFVKDGGVKCMLKMRQTSAFNGYGALATILCRHAMEEPNTLSHSIEKVIRGRTLHSVPPPYRELIYLTRQVGGAATRSPDTFYEVAKSILRVDCSIYRRLNLLLEDDVDTRLPMRAEANTRQAPIMEEDVSVEVIYDLLNALLQPLELSVPDTAAPELTAVPATLTSTTRDTVYQRASDLLSTGASTSAEILNIDGQDDSSTATPVLGTKLSRTSSDTALDNRMEQELARKPLLAKHSILKMLANAVVSYAAVAKLIAEFTFKIGTHDTITEDCTALAFMIDKLLPVTENTSDRDCSMTCRMLIAAISSCNHSPDAQSILVNEIKAALQRALLLPESFEKHTQVQLVTGIITTMIENCPPTNQLRVFKTQPLGVQMNNIVRLMLRKGIFNDLARIPQYLDLSSPNFTVTANAALKPMEALSRIVNQPVNNSNEGKLSKKAQPAQLEDAAATQSGNTSTEATNAQMEEEVIEDTENTEHDISAVASSLEATTEMSRVQEEGDNALEDIMDQLLERNGGDNNRSYSDVASSRNHHAMDIDEDGNLDFDHERDATEELMSTDTGESDSNATDQEVEDDEENEVDEEIDEQDDETEDNNYEEDPNVESAQLFADNSTIFHIAANMDRDEDILMIQYADHEADNETLPRMVRWGENGFAIPIFDEHNNSTDQAAALVNHPLLISRHGNSDSATTGAAVTRTPRANRTRRYQYLQINSRNSNPPVILQRLLGPAAQNLTLGTNQMINSPGTRDSARVVVMDNLRLFPTNEEQIDFVDQSGYLFGPSLAATLNHVPSVLHWWNEESRLLDSESTYDVTTFMCNKLIPTLFEHRDAEMAERKRKREEEENKASRNKPKIDEAAVKTAENLDRPALLYNENNGPAADSDNSDSPVQNESQPNSQPVSGAGRIIQAIPVEFAPIPPQGRPNIFGPPGAGRLDPQNYRPIPVVHLPHRFEPPPQSGQDWIPDHSGRNNRVADNAVTHDPISDMENAGYAYEIEPFEETFELPGLMANLNENQPPPENYMFMPSPPPLELINEERIIDRDDSEDVLHITTGEEDQEEEQEEEESNDEHQEELSYGIFPTRYSLLSSHFPMVPSATENLAPVYSDTQGNREDQHSAHGETTSTSGNQSSNSQESDTSSSQPQPSSDSNNGASTSNTNDVVMANTTDRATDVSDDIPEGVDPSFLEALPPEIRREVLDQYRMVRLQQRTTAVRTIEPGAPGTSTEVSPEFLAALPPALQEEVLIQQRLEQRRQAAARANPDEPVDAGAFFETLQPQLRTMILSDMEDSQMSALPPDLAAEAQTLRRDWEARNRQMVQERFLQSNLTTIIRHSARGRLGSRLHPQLLPQRAQWGSWGRTEVLSNNPNAHWKVRGRQLLDYESLSCLLVLLFTDDPRLNTLRLHRVIRNLCYHGPTRDWIVKSLLSIIDRSVHVKPDENLNKPLRRTPRPGPLTSKLLTDSRNIGNGANWLNIRMEAALGCHANVFVVNRSFGKRSERYNSSSVTIHPQAAPVVCKNALDLFISLSKSFPTFLLPLKTKEEREEKAKANPSPSKNKSDSADFWDMLLKLDCATKKGKSLAKAHPNLSLCSEPDITNVTFEQSAFGQLLCMLSSPVIYRSMQLTDKLLRLLSVITTGLCELTKNISPTKNPKTKTQKVESVSAPESALNLAVNVLTYKSCSEDGLEDVTGLLLNLAHCSLDMSYVILNLLMTGAMRIGEVVREQIQHMLLELRNLNRVHKRKTHDELGGNSHKGVVSNRFTKESVVITASVKVKTSCDLQLPSMAPLTSKTSSQIFFLRVLRVIVQIREVIKKALKKEEEDAERKRTEEASGDATDKDPFQPLLTEDVMHPHLPALSDQLLGLENLWDTLSQCLLELEHTPDHHAVLVLQPAVEAFFLVHSPQQGATDRDSNKTPNTSLEPETTNPPALLTMPQSQDPEHSIIDVRSSMPSDQLKFLTFAEKHRTVLNQILRQTTAHLSDGPFSVLVDHTKVLDFDVKRRYFRTELERLDQGIRREETAVHVRRSHVFEDSFRELYRRSPEEWKNRFYIVFEDEEGQDAGGLLREWYMIISRDIFNPMYALFTISPGDRVTYMINPASHYNPNHLCYYKFVGRVIAKAIYDNKLLECYFTRSFYKHILGIPVKYTDMESEDYSFYRGLVYLMENNINNLGYDLTFSTEINEFGVTETRDLIPDGRNVAVTEDNKMEYVRLSCQMKMTGAIRQQLNAFLEGFYDIIPMRLIAIFNEQELELLISGLPNVDIDDLKANTEYHKYQSNSLQIQWFWRALRSFDQADRAKFLQFVTGTSKVPLQGFAHLEGMNGVQKFQIHRDDRSTDRLPSAHTCFNQLDLPVYETYDKLRSYLLKAIHECSEGFGFA